MANQKLYRVNESEHFNLMSMYDHIMVLRDDAIDSGDYDAAEKYQAQVDEVIELMDKAPCVGARVTWPVLSRIRAIQHERQLIRYQAGLAAGSSEPDAALAFTV